MILFIDDEERIMDNYVRELQLSGYRVSFQKAVDPAISTFQQEQDQIKLVILDIMMPSGTVFDKVDTEKGLRTGVQFYKWLRKAKSTLPVIVFTNVSDEKIKKTFSREKNCWYLAKPDYLPFELADKVGEILGQNQSFD